MTKLTWDSIIALVVVIGCFCLIGVGQDGEVKAVLGTAIGYIFGKVAATVAPIIKP